MRTIGLFLAIVVAALALNCGTIANSDQCLITAAIVPPAGTADHAAASPGNEVQFSLTSSVKGNCPLVADRGGTWSTSDPANTAISNQPGTEGQSPVSTQRPLRPPSTTAAQFVGTRTLRRR